MPVPRGGIVIDAGVPGFPAGGGTNGGGGGVTNVAGYNTPVYTTNSDLNYNDYANFWLAIGTSGSNTQANLTIQNTLSNLTYEILTNSSLDTNLADWGVWQVLTASNSVIVAPPFPIGSNSLFFASQLVLITGTNQIADWWAMKYFGTLAVDPYADPDGDGLCNYSEYILGSNPTNAHSMSASKTDAQYFFLAYTNDASTRMLLFQSNGPGTNAVTLTLSNTLVGSNYQIYSKDMSVTNGAWRVETNFLGTNTATQITIPLNGRTLAFIGGDGEDPDGDGLPSGYEVLATHTDPLLADTGNTGTPDGYKDPDGDGYVNLTEYYNGTDPLVFNPPPGVPDLNEDYLSGTNGSTSITWQPASGSVLGYIVTSNGVPVATNSPSQLSYVDNAATAGTDAIQVQVLYSGGVSSASSAILNPELASYSTAFVIVNGPGGHRYLVASTNLPYLAAIHVEGWEETVGYPINDVSSPQRYLQPEAYFPNGGDSGDPYWSAWVAFDIPISSFTNGIAQVPDSDLPPYAEYDLYFQAVADDGQAGDLSGPYPSGLYAMPFLDGTAQMKQNVAFLLKMGSLYYTLTSGSQFTTLLTPYGYVYSDYYFYDQAGQQVDWNLFAPFEDNYFYRNLVFDTNHIDRTGHLQTGFAPLTSNGDGYLGDATAFGYAFPTANYLTYSNNAAIAAILSSNVTQWVGYDDDSLLGDFTTYSWRNPQFNGFQLDYTSLQVTVSNSAIQFETISATNFPGYYSGNRGLPFYAGTLAPNLHTVGYYFARVGQDPQPGFFEGRGTFYSGIATVPLMLGSVGQGMTIAGYAQQHDLTGGNYAYLGQYFTNAFTMTNGIVTTNSAGLVSEYGEFFPTIPGHVALLTKPDPDQTNIQGTCQLDIIRLSLDVNHDGTMDESLTGPDNTTSSTPFVFWVNNNYDRFVLDSDGLNFYDDDVQVASCPYTNAPTPDYDFKDGGGNRVISCARDLQDYARLWVSGVDTNLLAKLPSGSTVTLSWGDVGTPNTNNPTIDLFVAADADGGIGYLTNSTTAFIQEDTLLCPYVGRLGPGQSIQLNASTFSNHWAGNHFIWCGVNYGSGALTMTIADGSGNTLAQTTMYMQLVDIKQMYERWTVGDNPTINPTNTAYLAEEGLQPFTQAFQYGPATDTNTPYILYVHGWNMKIWDKDRFAESAFKRLYWQGYQGRFGSFRWPTDYGFEGNWSALTNPRNFDNSEFQAWKSAKGLLNKLNDLNAKYPGHVYLLAHSMGNVVAGEALRLAGTNKVVNTYVGSQGAVTAHAYDGSITNSTYLLPFTYAYPTGPLSLLPGFLTHYGPDTPNIYTNRLAGNSAGVGRRVNFYNVNDYALAMPRWGFNQITKPDESGGQIYQYNGSTNDPPPWNHFSMSQSGHFPTIFRHRHQAD